MKFIIKLRNFPDYEIKFPIDWHINPFNNTNWQWYLHCFQYIEPNLKNYWNTKNLSYLRLLEDVVLSWIDEFENSTFEEYPLYVWHDHSTALRAIQFCKLFQFKKLQEKCVFNDDFLFKLNNSLEKHKKFLLTEKYYQKNTNHGMDQAHALFQLGKALDCKLSIQTALKRIKDEYEFAFTSEGVHKENSPNYHTYVLYRFGEIFNDIKYYDQNLCDDFKILAEKAILFIAHILEPHSGKYPIIGDSENIVPVDLSKIDLFKGLSSIKYFNFAKSRGSIGENFYPHKIYPESGYGIFRGIAKNLEFNEQIHLIIKAGSLSRYHYHCDELSFILSAYEEDWIIDSGCYNYDNYDKIRKYVRSRAAHNLPCIYGINDSYAEDRKFSEWKIIDFSEDEYIPFITIINSFYKNIIIKRNLIFYSDKNKFIINDLIENNTEDTHIVHFYFHVPSDKTIRFNNNNIIIISMNKILVLSINSSEIFNIIIKKGKDKNNNIKSITSKVKYEYTSSYCIDILFKLKNTIKTSFEFNFINK